MLNCDSLQYLLDRWDREKGSCQSFPQHGTITMTLDSSVFLFNAYRELGRQYLRQVNELLTALTNQDPGGVASFEKIAIAQASPMQAISDRFMDGAKRRPVKCDPTRSGPWQPLAEVASR